MAPPADAGGDDLGRRSDRKKYFKVNDKRYLGCGGGRRTVGQRLGLAASASRMPTYIERLEGGSYRKRIVCFESRGGRRRRGNRTSCAGAPDPRARSSVSTRHPGKPPELIFCRCSDHSRSCPPKPARQQPKLKRPLLEGVNLGAHAIPEPSWRTMARSPRPPRGRPVDPRLDEAGIKPRGSPESPPAQSPVLQEWERGILCTITFWACQSGRGKAAGGGLMRHDDTGLLRGLRGAAQCDSLRTSRRLIGSWL